MDWGASGLTNSFEYELVDVVTLEHAGWLEGVTGGRITEDYNGDLRSSCTLDIEGGDLPLHYAVRVWHTAEVNGEVYRHALGTFMRDSIPMEMRRGRKAGTASLQSMLYGLSKDVRPNDSAQAAGQNVVSRFTTVASNARRVPYVPSMFSTLKVTSAAYTWEFGESCLTELNRLAAAMSPRARLMTDEMGRVTVERYTLPSKRTSSWRIGPDMLLCGLAVNEPEICNKVAVKGAVGGVDYFASASVADSHEWHADKIGYWATKTYTASELPETGVQDRLQSLADSYLAENSKTLRTFGATAIYAPLAMGSAGRLTYADSKDGDEVTAKVWLSQRSISLDKTMLCELTLEEVG